MPFVSAQGFQSFSLNKAVAENDTDDSDENETRKVVGPKTKTLSWKRLKRRE